MANSRYVALTLLLCVAGAAVGESFYESNASGMRVKEVRQPGPGEYAYLLVVDDTGPSVIERLLHEGAEVRRVVITEDADGALRESYVNGRIVSAVRYESRLPIEERFYDDGELSERYEYSYTAGKLSGVTRFDAVGTRIESVGYGRMSSGRISRSELDAGEGSRVSIYRSDERGVYESWLGDGENGGTLYRYDGEELVGIERWNGDRLVRIETIEVSPEGRRRTIKDLEAGRTILRNYGRDGRLLEETITSGGERVEQTRYRYDDGLLVESVRLYSGGSEQHRFVYDEAGELIRESVSTNTVLQKVVVWTGTGEHYEEIYRNGAPVLRVYFEGDRKVSEEMVR